MARQTIAMPKAPERPPTCTRGVASTGATVILLNEADLAGRDGEWRRSFASNAPTRPTASIFERMHGMGVSMPASGET
jgi:hypothetical protein